MESKLKPYSLGIVVEHKPADSGNILVSPMETLNVQEPGNMRAQTKTFKGTMSDSEGNSFTTENTSTGHIVAKWLPLGTSNRTSPPDVRAGETVLIYKFANVEEYFWEDIIHEPELRRLEDVLYSYSNMRETLEPYTDETSYWVRVSTRDKFIHLRTNKNDEEPFTYDIKLDTKEGNLVIMDDVGNHIKLDSPTNTVEVVTEHECNVTVKNNVNIVAGNDVTVNAGNDIIVEAGNDITVTAGNDIKATAGNDITAEAGNNITVTAGADIVGSAGGNINLDAGASIMVVAGASATIQAPTITLDGVVMTTGSATVAGPLSAAGGAAVLSAGGAAIDGSVAATGDLTTDGNVVAAMVQSLGVILNAGGDIERYKNA